MLKREQIRYCNFWVRLVCCFFVALVVAKAVNSRGLDAWEEVAADLVLRSNASVQPVSVTAQTWLVFAIALAPALLYIERPVTMVLAGGLYAGGYFLVAFVVAMLWHVAFPIAAPLLGIIGSATFLETMAWSEERRKRTALEELEVAKQQSTDMLVHDLRRRMSTILMSSSLLDRRSQLDSGEVQDLVDTIRVSAQRMLIEIDDILAVRKIEEGKLLLQKKPVALGTLIRAILGEHSKAIELIGVGVRLADDDAGRNVYASLDAKIFGRVMANLLWNGLQHAPRGSEIEVGYGEAGQDVIVYVANRGKTVAPEQQAQLFEAFVSGPEDDESAFGFGIGLGLAFCRLAVEAHGGQIYVESPWKLHGDGVKMIVILPASVNG